MTRVLMTFICLALLLSWGAKLVMSKEVDKTERLRCEMQLSGNSAALASDRDLSKFKQVTAVVDTIFITGRYDFDVGPTCGMQGWVTVDLTVPTDLYWHVADNTELDGGTYGRLNVLRGDQTLWCGLYCDTTAFPPCGWVEPPGYGNDWNQIWQTKACVDVESSVELEYVFSCDSERDYDATYVEVADCGTENWVLVDGGKLVFDDAIVDSTRVTQITGFDSSSIDIRFRFNSDDSWSDEDGFYVGDGAFLLDNLVVRDNTGDLLPLEDFEDESPGDLQSNDWGKGAAPFGDYAGLKSGYDVLQEDLCWTDLSCFWEFFDGANTSMYDYSCGGHSEQLAMPHGDGDIGYMWNEVWSPQSSWTGFGSVAVLEFDVYRDLPLDNLQVYVWHVRSWEGSNPGVWRDRELVYYGDDKAWLHHTEQYADLILPTATSVQFALGAVDMKHAWGPGSSEPRGSGACHSQAPLFDNFRAYRLKVEGPVWSVRDIDMFQDTFPRDGTLSGTGRADMAMDPVHGLADPVYYPGDSASVYSCVDVVNGLVSTGVPPYDHRSVYCFVSVSPPDSGKAGMYLENTYLLGGVPRFPFRGVAYGAGRAWTKLNCDRERDSNNVAISDTRFCIDLPDDLFERGDTILYFFGAHNSLNQWSYWSRAAGTVYTIDEAADKPNEFQILPGSGFAHGGDILYVDGMDGRGAQPLFDTAFQKLGIYHLVDRYDVNAPAAGVSNRLGTRVYGTTQLTTPYRKIIWNTGDLSMTIGDGTGNPLKSDDWLVLDAFLTDLRADKKTGGLYLNGDDLPSVWDGQTGASAIAMRDWLHYSVPPGGDNHVPKVGVNPYGMGTPISGSAFGDPMTHPFGPDTLVVLGSCPGVNDFDFVNPEGNAMKQMRYHGVGDAGPDSATASIGERIAGAGPPPYAIGVLMSGFSFHYIREDRVAPEMDRVHHMRDVLVWLGNVPNAPVGTDDAPEYKNSLAQNYPNPFNPTTTIVFTVKERARVNLKIYNVAGQLVKELVNDVREPGVTHAVPWDGRNSAGQSVSSGVYFYKLVTRDFTQTKKMVLLK